MTWSCLAKRSNRIGLLVGRLPSIPAVRTFHSFMALFWQPPTMLGARSIFQLFSFDGVKKICAVMAVYLKRLWRKYLKSKIDEIKNNI